MKKFLNTAFTMAEAILVMTILGIIATIMISTLKPAEFKDKGLAVLAKKVLSEIDTATTQILLNNTMDGTFNSGKIYEANSSNTFTLDTMDANYPQSQKLITLYKKYLATRRMSPAEKETYGNTTIILKDGAHLRIIYQLRMDVPTIFPGENTNTVMTPPCGFIDLDINGEEPPNVRGKDVFTIPLGKNGIEYLK